MSKAPLKGRPAGLLVLYDEGKGVAEAEVKVFPPSSTVDADVSEWIKSESDVNLHRVDWIPSGGLLGASVVYSRGEGATQALRIVVPGLAGLEKRVQNKKPLESAAVFMLFAGVILGLIGVMLFYVFYPDTWYGETGALIDSQTAVKVTGLAVGLGVFLTFAGVAALFRARIT